MVNEINLLTLSLFQAILTQLRTIFDLIIQFQQIQENMYTATSEELAARKCYQDKVQRNQKQVIG